MAAVTPLPRNPSNSDLAKGIEQLHECLEDHRENSKKNTETVKAEIDLVNAKLEGLAANQTTLLTALNIVHKDNEAAVKSKPLALMGQGEAFVKLGGALSAIFVIWKLIGIALPYAWAFLKALNNSVIH